MKLIFAGTPDFAAQALRALILAKHEILLVLTQPDRPSGRGMKQQASPVKIVAEKAGIPVFQPPSLKAAEAQAYLQKLDADLMIVAAYGLILPQAVLDFPRYGGLNIHASLLPRWRGAAPIQRAILAGDSQTGIAIMQMAAGLDTGDVWQMRALPILPNDSAGSLHDKLAKLGAEMIVETLSDAPFILGKTPTPQTQAGISYAHKIEKSEALINWQLSADELVRQIRAFNPFPGAFSTLNNQPIKIWQAVLASSANIPENTAPGTIVLADKEAIIVACGQGALSLTELQKAGSRRLTVHEFQAGKPLLAGMRFEGALSSST